jgi:hypothetical protein
VRLERLLQLNFRRVPLGMQKLGFNAKGFLGNLRMFMYGACLTLPPVGIYLVERWNDSDDTLTSARNNRVVCHAV